MPGARHCASEDAGGKGGAGKVGVCLSANRPALRNSQGR